MSGRVAWGVERGQCSRRRAIELDSFAFLNQAVDLDDAVEALRGHGVRPEGQLKPLPKRHGASHVVGMVMGGQDRDGLDAA